jgi:hypothetical protein
MLSFYYGTPTVERLEKCLDVLFYCQLTRLSSDIFEVPTVMGNKMIN